MGLVEEGRGWQELLRVFLCDPLIILVGFFVLLFLGSCCTTDDQSAVWFYSQAPDTMAVRKGEAQVLPNSKDS